MKFKKGFNQTMHLMMENLKNMENLGEKKPCFPYVGKRNAAAAEKLEAMGLVTVQGMGKWFTVYLNVAEQGEE